MCQAADFFFSLSLSPDNAKRVWLWSVRPTGITKDRPSKLCQNLSGEDPRRKVRLTKHCQSVVYVEQSAASTRRDAVATKADVAWLPKDPPAEVNEMEVEDAKFDLQFAANHARDPRSCWKSENWKRTCCAQLM